MTQQPMQQSYQHKPRCSSCSIEVDILFGTFCESCFTKEVNVNTNETRQLEPRSNWLVELWNKTVISTWLKRYKEQKRWETEMKYRAKLEARDQIQEQVKKVIIKQEVEKYTKKGNTWDKLAKGFATNTGGEKKDYAAMMGGNIKKKDYGSMIGSGNRSNNNQKDYPNILSGKNNNNSRKDYAAMLNGDNKKKERSRW